MIEAHRRLYHSTLGLRIMQKKFSDLNATKRWNHFTVDGLAPAASSVDTLLIPQAEEPYTVNLHGLPVPRLASGSARAV